MESERRGWKAMEASHLLAHHAPPRLRHAARRNPCRRRRPNAPRRRRRRASRSVVHHRSRGEGRRGARRLLPLGDLAQQLVRLALEVTDELEQLLGLGAVRHVLKGRGGDEGPSGAERGAQRSTERSGADASSGSNGSRTAAEATAAAAAADDPWLGRWSYQARQLLLQAEQRVPGR